MSIILFISTMRLILISNLITILPSRHLYLLDNLPGAGLTFLDFTDQGKPASANLQTSVSVQITRMLQDFEGFSDFPFLMLLLSCDD